MLEWLVYKRCSHPQWPEVAAEALAPEFLHLPSPQDSQRRRSPNSPANEGRPRNRCNPRATPGCGSGAPHTCCRRWPSWRCVKRARDRGDVQASARQPRGESHGELRSKTRRERPNEAKYNDGVPQPLGARGIEIPRQFRGSESMAIVLLSARRIHNNTTNVLATNTTRIAQET